MAMPIRAEVTDLAMEKDVKRVGSVEVPFVNHGVIADDDEGLGIGLREQITQPGAVSVPEVRKADRCGKVRQDSFLQ